MPERRPDSEGDEEGRRAKAESVERLLTRRRMVGLGLSVLVAAGLAAGAMVYWYTYNREPSWSGGPHSYFALETEYQFKPNQMRWRVGEQVQLTLLNDSTTSPGKSHAFVVGQDVIRVPVVLGPPSPTDSFQRDFFDGVKINVTHSRDVVKWVKPASVRLVGPAVPQGAVKPVGTPPVEQSMKIVLHPEGYVTMRFTVPDRPGRWTFMCPMQDSQHFINGMIGTVTVVPR